LRKQKDFEHAVFPLSNHLAVGVFQEIRRHSRHRNIIPSGLSQVENHQIRGRMKVVSNGYHGVKNEIPVYERVDLGEQRARHLFQLRLVEAYERWSLRPRLWTFLRLGTIRLVGKTFTKSSINNARRHENGCIPRHLARARLAYLNVRSDAAARGASRLIMAIAVIAAALCADKSPIVIVILVAWGSSPVGKNAN
jgi:hypothetical protein